MATTEGIGGFLSVSVPAPATYDSTGFAALDWTDVEQSGDIPSYGGRADTVTFTPIKTGIKDKAHGEIEPGSFEIEMARDLDDAGQQILYDAYNSKAPISFRETKSDGSVLYGTMKVMGFEEGGSMIGSFVMAKAPVEILGKIVRGA